MGTPTFGSSTTFATGISNYHDSAMMTTTRSIVIYRDNVPNLYGCVLTMSGSSIIASTPVLIFWGNAQDPHITKMDTTHAIVTYRDNATGYGRAVCLSLSGSTITVNTIVSYHAAATYNGEVVSLSASSALACYVDNADSNKLKAIILSLSGTTITPETATEAIVDASMTWPQSSSMGLTALSSTLVVATYFDESPYDDASVTAISVSTVTPSPGTPVNITVEADIYAAVEIKKINSTKAILSYNKNNSGSKIQLATVDISGTTPTINTAYEFNDGGTKFELIMFSETYGIMFYNTSSLPYHGYGFEFGINSDAISFGSRSAAYTPGIINHNTAVLYGSNQAVISWPDSTDGAKGKALVATNSGTAPTKTYLPSTSVFYSRCDGDLSDNKHDLTLNGGIVFKPTGGVFDGHILFDGSNDYIAIPDHTDFTLGTNDFVLEFNINLTTFSSHQMVITQSQDGSINTSFAVMLYYNGASSELRFYYKTSIEVIKSFSWNPSTGTDYHVAIVRDSTNLRAFVDGTQIGTTQNIATDSISDSSRNLNIGIYYDGASAAYYLTGKMSFLRYINGDNNGWTGSTITVPTDYYTASDNASTVLLINADNFIDISGGDHDITTTTGQIIDSGAGGTNFKGVMTFDGTADVLTIPDSADWNFGDSDFTISMKLYFDSVASHHWFLYQGSGSDYIRIYWDQTLGQLYCEVTAGGTIEIDLSAAWSPSALTEYHLAMVRNGTDWRLYVDGVSLSSVTKTYTFPNFSGSLLLGAFATNAIWLDGWMDEILIAKEAVWTTAFTPPSSPYVLPDNKIIGVDIDRTYKYAQTIAVDILRDYIRDVNIVGININRNYKSYQTAEIKIGRSTKSKHTAGINVGRNYKYAHTAGINVDRNYKQTHDAGINIDRKYLALSSFRIYVDGVFAGYTDSSGNLIIALADGSYEIELRPSGFLWDECRYPKYYNVTILAGAIVSTGLPDIINLRADDLTGWGRDIYWTWQSDFNVTTPFDFALWFSATSPVNISGTPDAVVSAQDENRNHTYRYAQAAQMYVAVCARDSSGTKGTASELLLSYPSGSISSPTWQDARDGI